MKILIKYSIAYGIVLCFLISTCLFINSSKQEVKNEKVDKKECFVPLNLKSYETDSMINQYCDKRTPWKK